MRKFLFLDIDNTLSSFNHSEGLAQMLDSLRQNIEHAYFLNYYVNKTFADIMWGAKPQEELLAFLDDPIFERGVGALTTLQWSRELWMLKACRENQINIRVEWVHSASCAYWQGIRDSATLYPETLKVLQWCRQAQWQVILVTSSDAMLKPINDFEAFVYDADYAASQKRKRLPYEILQNADALFIGDPISKPHPSFWMDVLNAVNYIQGCDLAVMVGDSYLSDICNLGRFGIHGVLLDRDERNLPQNVPEAEWIMRSLDELTALLLKIERAHANGREHMQ